MRWNQHACAVVCITVGQLYKFYSSFSLHSCYEEEEEIKKTFDKTTKWWSSLRVKQSVRFFSDNFFSRCLRLSYYIFKKKSKKINLNWKICVSFIYLFSLPFGEHIRIVLSIWFWMGKEQSRNSRVLLIYYSILPQSRRLNVALLYEIK